MRCARDRYHLSPGPRAAQLLHLTRAARFSPPDSDTPALFPAPLHQSRATPPPRLAAQPFHPFAVTTPFLRLQSERVTTFASHPLPTCVAQSVVGRHLPVALQPVHDLPATAETPLFLEVPVRQETWSTPAYAGFHVLFLAAAAQHQASPPHRLHVQNPPSPSPLTKA